MIVRNALVLKMNQSSVTFFDDWYVFEDVILCAFRYAITRHTYVVREICDWIWKNRHILSKRMCNVMERDLYDTFTYYEKNITDYENHMDYKTLKEFGEKLADWKTGYDNMDDED